MTETIGLVRVREQVEIALLELRRFAPDPRSDFYEDWSHALRRLENVSQALYVRTVAPTAVEVLDVTTVQDLDVATARRVRGA